MSITKRMGPYLGAPKKDKDSVDGENDKVCFYRVKRCSLNMEHAGCKAGGIPWKMPISASLTWEKVFLSLESMMVMVVC